MFADIHCHLSFPEFDEDRDSVIDRLQQEQVSIVIDPGIDPASSRRSIHLAQSHPFIHANVGLHPLQVQAPFEENLLEELFLLAGSKKVVGIGEIGLDYHWPGFDRQLQLGAFRQMLRIAKSLDLPAAIHCRDAWPDMLKMLSEERSSNLRGVMHCFSGTLDIARECLRSNFRISIPGTVTYRNSSLPEIVAALDLKDLLAETDSPYLSPVPFRGRRNEPSRIVHVVNAIALIRHSSPESVAAGLADNTRELFRLP
jgi:TatD DNase family protein